MRAYEGVECLDFNVGALVPSEKKNIQVSVHWHQRDNGSFLTLRHLELKINDEVIVDIRGGVK